MNLHQASHLARTLLNQYGLLDWAFDYSKKTSNLGHCSYQEKTIYLSAPYTYTGDEQRVKNTILHEIAHALVGSGHHHDDVWRRKALEIGCNGQPQTTVNHEMPQMRYNLTCPIHGIVHQMSKMTRANYVCRKCKSVLSRAPNPKFTVQYFAIEADRPK